MSLHSNDGLSLQESLSEVITAAKVPTKRRGTSIKPTVENLAAECYDKGILPDSLRELIDLIISPSHLDQASLNNLIRNLYPATSIDDDILIKIVGGLGHGALKPSLVVQAALIRWMILTHHIFKVQNALSKVYGVLFNLLDTAAIRAQLCHILALITRRRHVRPYRIQALLALSRQTGNDPALTGLLRVFKNYYPEIIVGEATRGKASTFKYPDSQWRQRLDEIQRAHAQSIRDQNLPREAFRVARNFGNSRKVGKASLLPEVHTSHAQENSITLEEIESVDGLVSNLEKIELPNQLISVLADPLLQKLMLLKPDATSEERISNWLEGYSEEIIRGNSTNEADVGVFLEILQDYVSSTKNFSPAINSFFVSYLKIWDGQTGRECMLDILSHAALPENGFPYLYSQLFAPLEAKMLDGTVGTQQALLKCYTSLLQHWAVSILSKDNNASSLAPAASELMGHVNKLCLTALQISPNVLTHSLVLEFYELTAYMASNPSIGQHVRIVIPPSDLVYILHFSSSPATVARLCGILTLYKQGFQTAMATSRTGYDVRYINDFNGFLMDICNCLWRSRAFNHKDPNAHACLMPDNIISDLASYVSGLGKGSTLASLFTLSASPTLGLIATSFLRDLEDVEMEQGSDGLDTRHAGPVSRTSLMALGKNGGVSLTWDEFRLGVLGYLEQNGMEGVGRLMHSTMTTLMKRT